MQRIKAVPQSPFYFFCSLSKSEGVANYMKILSENCNRKSRCGKLSDNLLIKRADQSHHLLSSLQVARLFFCSLVKCRAESPAGRGKALCKPVQNLQISYFSHDGFATKITPSVIIIFREVIPAAALYFVGTIRSCRNMEATLCRSDLMANEQLYWFGCTSEWEQWH